VPHIAPDAIVTRVLDNVIVTRGTPRVALMAHLDTTGFTLGYKKQVLPIGSPAPRDKERVRCTTPMPDGRPLQGRLRKNETERGFRLEGIGHDFKAAAAPPGTRWLYDRAPKIKKGTITAPYLDNRAGVWCALRALARCPNVAVAFTTGEEQHGHGARICAERLYAEQGISRALIADITWHTDHTPCGKGVVVSVRDEFCPRQAFLHCVLDLAGASGITYQREIQRYGQSDGSHLLHSAVPVEWVFVGAPQKRPHTSREKVSLSDLDAMADLLAFLADRL
jgi:putative aminopeptidase FrvX